MDADDLVMEIEREQAKREYAAMHSKQNRLHELTCSPEIREQARQIAAAVMPQRHGDETFLARGAQGDPATNYVPAGPVKSRSSADRLLESRENTGFARN